jgi:hypothetical protein
MPPIPRPSASISAIASVALELFDARGWPDDENDPGANPGKVDRWVIVSIVVILGTCDHCCSDLASTLSGSS